MALSLVKQTAQNNKFKATVGLNQPQAEAVTQIDGALLIIAGAGSGKTRALTHRIAYLIEQGIAPYHILALTFTNKAANEMKHRIAGMLTPAQANSIWAGTFHSVFARILRFESEHIGYTGGFSIYDTEDSLKVVRSVMENLNISTKEMPPQAMRNRISWAKNHNLSWQQYSEAVTSTLEEQTAKVYEAYEKQLRQNNSMDFDDLLINFIKVLKLRRDVLEKYQDRFKYLLVDEYQDTNHAQYLAIKLLANKEKNICVVGDDAQSIYRWRGAEIKNILDFKKDYPDAKIVRLEQNYRSTKTILDAAASVIRRNQNQIPKKLWTENPQGELIKVLQADSDSHEAEMIANQIFRQTKDGDLQPGDFAVLYRTNAQSLALEKALRTIKLPYVVVGGISFYQRKEIKDVLCYLRLLVNQNDSEALMRIVNEPPRGLGAVSIKHIRDFANVKDLSLYESFLNANEINELQQRAKSSAIGFIELIDKYIELAYLSSEKMSIGEIAIKYIEETGILDMYKEIGTEDALDRWNNIQQLLSDISSFFKENSGLKLEDYLQQMTLITNIDDTDISKGEVKLMTLHTAKGLEFPVVFISGLEHGLFPISRIDTTSEEEEEERRLFYVGITRAQEKLFLSYARSRMRFGEYLPSAPSKFLSEIDPTFLDFPDRNQSKPNNINKVSNTNNFHNKQTDLNDLQRSISGNSHTEKTVNTSFFDDSPNHQQSYSQIPEDFTTYKVGDRVAHSKFGKGRIVALSGEGKNAKAMVDFHEQGKKRLMLFYANLKKF